MAPQYNTAEALGSGITDAETRKVLLRVGPNGQKRSNAEIAALSTQVANRELGFQTVGNQGQDAALNAQFGSIQNAAGSTPAQQATGLTATQPTLNQKQTEANALVQKALYKLVQPLKEAAAAIESSASVQLDQINNSEKILEQPKDVFLDLPD
jgi:hypothetical protein